MRFSNLILLLLASCCLFDIAECIQNGKKVTKWQLHTKFEYVVALKTRFVKGRVSVCTGAILDDFTILTAAHCLYDSDKRKYAYEIELRVGTATNAQTIIVGGKQRRVDRFIMLQSYVDTDNLELDVAMIKLEKSLKLKSLYNRYTLKAVTLPPEDLVTDGKEAVMAGYGYFTRRNNVPYTDDKLKKSDVVIVPRENCTNRRRGRVDGIICTALSSTPGCAGDSGGPLVIRNGGEAQIIGVIVLGSAHCGGDELPTLFVRVSKHLDFIEKVKNNEIITSDGRYVVQSMTGAQSCLSKCLPTESCEPR